MQMIRIWLSPDLSNSHGDTCEAEVQPAGSHGGGAEKSEVGPRRLWIPETGIEKGIALEDNYTL